MVKNLPINTGDVGSIPELGRKWQPTPIFLSRKSHGQRSLAGCPKGCRVRQDLPTKQTTTKGGPGGVINSCTILWLMMR